MIAEIEPQPAHEDASRPALKVQTKDPRSAEEAASSQRSVLRELCLRMRIFQVRSHRGAGILAQVLLLTICASVPISATAQELVSPEEMSAVSKLIESHATARPLRCDVHVQKPSLDFNLRFEAGFEVNFRPPRIVPGRDFITYLRVTPEGGAPVFLSEEFSLPPGLSRGLGDSGLVIPRSAFLTASGAFNIGEGRYAIEFLLVDGQRNCYKRWTVKTDKYGNGNQVVPLALPPGSVAAVVPESWDGALDRGGMRLTVLLDAAPIEAFSPRLHAWDRALLLQALASLLRQAPCQSVQLIAFNLDQQREIFRRQKFDSGAFYELAIALKNTEQATIPYQALQRGSVRRFLLQLVQEQTSAQHPPDAVVFLGPATHFDERAQLPPDWQPRSRFFYFEFHYFGALFPDVISRLTKDMRGTVLPFSSGNEFAAAIQKLRAQVKPAGTQEVGPLPLLVREPS